MPSALHPDPRRLQRVARMAAVCSHPRSKYGACVCCVALVSAVWRLCLLCGACVCCVALVSAVWRLCLLCGACVPRLPCGMKARRPVADSPAALGVRALYRKMVCSQRGGLVLPACNTPSRLHLRPRPVHPRHTAGPSNVLLAWVLRHHLACQVDLLPALSCHSPHSPRHHHSPPSSSCRSSRQPPVPAATLNAASPAAAPSSDHAAACVARLSSPADSAQQPVQSARAAASSASAELADHMCLLVHINGMAWLADAGPSFPSPPISIHYTRPSIPCCDVMCDSHSHPFSLLTQAFPLHATSLSHHPSPPQHQDAGVYRISPCAPPHPPAPAGAAPWVRGRGAGAVSVAPACTADGWEKPVAAVAAADRAGRDGGQ
ncbi:unnamed protein product [Closterium sp. NIES-65]|nr:unnamed protein product [Closterium sp. NIES-65]